MNIEFKIDMLLSYANAEPIKHIVFDNFLPSWVAVDILKHFPEPNTKWYRYENVLEKKLATDRFENMSYQIQQICMEFNSQVFVEFLEKLTGIEGLISDPGLRGGGCHYIAKDGFLDLHTDFAVHPKLNLYRRINALLYLVPDYTEDMGGALELWDRDLKFSIKIAPLFNRLVVFNTNATSFHGHPDPWRSPIPRRSLAFYYYTAKKPLDEEINLNSTTFVARPGDPDSDEKKQLRLVRSKGRVSSNVT